MAAGLLLLEAAPGSSANSESWSWLLFSIICICPIISFCVLLSIDVFSWNKALSSSSGFHLRSISIRNCQSNTNIILSIIITAYFSATQLTSSLNDFSISTRLRHCSLLSHSKKAATIFLS